MKAAEELKRADKIRVSLCNRAGSDVYMILQMQRGIIHLTASNYKRHLII